MAISKITSAGVDPNSIATNGTNGAIDVNASAPADSLVISSAGNVGVGGSAPSTNKLHVTSTGQTRAVVYNSTNLVGVRIQAETSAGLVQTDTNHPLRFATNNGAPQLIIDTSGRVTMPYQPMFSAKKITGQNLSGGTTADITFTSALVNIGSHYNTSTSKFTAPIAGTYYFSIQTNIAPGTASYFSLIPLKNGSALGNVAAFTGSVSNGGYENVSISFILTLAAADYISCELQHNGNPTIDNAGVFCGFLIG